MNKNKNLKQVKECKSKNSAPECPKKNKPVRVCTDVKCGGIKNKIMCGNQSCECNNKSHQNCYQVINFQCFENLLESCKKRSYKDLFENILIDLSIIIDKAVEIYNFTVVALDTFLLPQPIEKLKKKMNRDGIIQKNQSTQLKKFYDKYPEFTIPDLQLQPVYIKGISDIKGVITKFGSACDQFRQNMQKSLEEHDKKSKGTIMQKNDRIIENKKKEQKIERPTRSTSSNKK